MTERSWGFAEDYDNEIARGWRGTATQALEHAQSLANERGITIRFWCETESNSRVDVEPSKGVPLARLGRNRP